MGIRRVAGSDATAARKIARSEPMAPRDARADETPRLSHIERLRPGDDPTAAINRLYGVGRSYPHGKPHDAPRQGKPGYTTPVPTRDEEYAHYGQATRDERLTFDEQAPQTPADKHGASYDNDSGGWVRGRGPEAPHPHFDHSPPRGKERR
jgi:hypothetical protein